MTSVSMRRLGELCAVVRAGTELGSGEDVSSERAGATKAGLGGGEAGAWESGWRGRGAALWASGAGRVLYRVNPKGLTRVSCPPRQRSHGPSSTVLAVDNDSRAELLSSYARARSFI